VTPRPGAGSSRLRASLPQRSEPDAILACDSVAPGVAS
jgi:hypothetical protein